jgi:hypothetical protein
MASLQNECKVSREAPGHDFGMTGSRPDTNHTGLILHSHQTVRDR